MSNLLKAILQIVENNNTLPTVASGKNKINSVGDAMEQYIKNAFAECLDKDNTII